MDNDKPSKTARKRAQHALQELGEYLISLKGSELDKMELDEELMHAVRAAMRIKSHGALRRQKQLIGKLMRQADADAIRARLDQLGARQRAEKQLFARAERWRDKLLTGGRSTLADFESETATEDTELRALLAELETTDNERREKNLKRQVFRRVHAILVRIPK